MTKLRAFNDKDLELIHLMAEATNSALKYSMGPEDSFITIYVYRSKPFSWFNVVVQMNYKLLSKTLLEPEWFGKPEYKY